MKTLKKLLCVVLSVVLALSTFAIVANAALVTATTGTIDESKINIKYEIEQVDGTPMYTAVDNNIYKLTVYCDAVYGVSFLTLPIHFDKTKFAIVMADDADIIGNMMYSYDGNNADIGDNLVYLYDEPESFSCEAMLNSSGTAVTALRSATYVGLGNSNASAVTPTWNLIDTSNDLHDTWMANMTDENTGIAYYLLDDLKKAKNAHLNTYNGAVIDGWADMGSIYFIRLPGVTEEDVIGSEFGAFEGGYGCEGLWDTSGKPSYVSTTYVEGEPGLNIVSNAVVEAAAEPSPVYAKGSQIRFNSTEANGTGSANFDVRTRAAMTAEDFASICGEDSVAKTAITDVGFVYADSSVGMDLTAAASVIAGTSVDGYVKKPVEHIQSTGTEYVWTCLITDAAYADAVDSVGYIVVNGTTYFFDAVYATSFSTLYDTWYSSYAAA